MTLISDTSHPVLSRKLNTADVKISSGPHAVKCLHFLSVPLFSLQGIQFAQVSGKDYTT